MSASSRRVVCVALWLLWARPAAAQTFSDEFITPGNRLDSAKWTTEFYTETCNPSFFGRTQLQDWVRPDGVGRFSVENGAARLALDTHNPTSLASNPSFFGTHAKTGTYDPPTRAETETTFAPSATTDVVLAVRMRLTTLQRGIVYAIYFYTRGGPCADRHDEADIELVTNFLQPGQSPLRVQLNRYRNEPLGEGHGPIVNLPPGFDPLVEHEWKIRWGSSRLTYFVDDVVLFSTPADDAFVPERPMHADMVAWAPDCNPGNPPDPGWCAAYDASLQPVTNASANQTFVALIDRFMVRTAPAFTDSHLRPTATVIRLDHLRELREHVNSARVREELGEFSWRDDLAVGSLVRAQHIVELRMALEAVYQARGHSPPHYTDEALGTGTPIKATHVDELRLAVMAVE
jgi:hypothetical protein